MPAAVKMWEIVDDSLHPVTNDSFASGHFENQLETCVAKDPNILGDRMLIILKQPLKEKFCDYFDADEFPQLSCQKHRIVLAAPRLDASAERIITYLSEQYAVPINAVFFPYARLKGGKRSSGAGHARVRRYLPSTEDLQGPTKR